jgi:hypothetical protein
VTRAVEAFAAETHVQVNTAPSSPLGPAPLRRLRSVRRTSSLQATWPEGRGGVLLLSGHARDIVTGEKRSAPETLAEDRLSVRIRADRIIESASAERPVPGLASLVGLSSIAGLRSAVAAGLTDEAAAGTPLYTLLEDIPGVSVVSKVAWTRWPETRAQQMQENAQSRQSRQGVCIGLAPGSSGLTVASHPAPRVPPLIHPRDPQGWHPLPVEGDVDMWRVRRIDVWLEDGLLRVDSMFQDSAAAPGGREAVHEYNLLATVDPRRRLLIEVHAQPHILPFVECPAAAANLHRILDTPLSELRSRVLETLRCTAGCTHLNDAVRALAEVSQMAAPLLT